MLVQSAYEILGLDPTASLDHIKCAYRFLAKKWHPDKNCCDGSTAQFQQVNLAYQTLISCHTPTDHDENSSPAGSGCVESMFNMSLQTKQNTFSITIDITDLMFLVILSECETHHGVSPIDRGVNGQLRFPYTSPGEPEHYGSISLTFYPTTSRLLVQGSSYLLWVNEHLPAICKQAENRYMQDASSWTALARRRGIGLKRDGRSARNLRSSRSSWSDDSIPASAPSLNDPQEKTRESPAAAFGERAALTDGLVPPSPDGLVPPSPIPLPVLSDSSLSVNQPACAEVTTEDLLSDAEPSPETADSTDPDPAHAEIGNDGESATGVPRTLKKKRPKGKKSTKVKKKTVSFDLPDHPATSDSDKHGHSCTTKCKVTNNANMIRCSLCMAWYHVECAGEDSDYQGVWCCNSCRTLPKFIQNLSVQIESLVSCVKSIERKEVALKTEVQQLKAENGNLRSKLAHTVQHANDLAKLVETMSFSTTNVSSNILNDASNSDSPTSHQSFLPSPRPHITVPTANRFEALSDAVQPQQRQRHMPHTRGNHPRTVTSSADDATITVIGSSIVRGVAYGKPKRKKFKT